MDINSFEAKILRQRVTDGHMEIVPNGIRDRPRRQVYGMTTQQRVYRLDEDSNSYNILSKSRDHFVMVRCLKPGETVLHDGTFTNLTLLPDKTFYENCVDNCVRITQKVLILGVVAIPAYLIGLTFLQILVFSAVIFVCDQLG